MQPGRAEPPSAATPARRAAPAPRAQERPEEKPVDFSLSLPTAKSASLAGSFNSWDPGRTPLRKEKKGDWKTTLRLRPGRYEYRFVVDGQWMSDPKAKESIANDFGTTNSVDRRVAADVGGWLRVNVPRSATSSDCFCP